MTFNRAEYGLLRAIIEDIKQDSFFDLKLVVGGSHLKKEYGATKNEILNDKNIIDQEIDYLPDSTDAYELAEKSSKILLELIPFLKKESPDACMVLGDRYELLQVAYSCLMCNIPLLHICGGEITEGNIDNQIRHALSKMAHLHFVANEEFKKNIIKMAEEPWRICVSGEPGLDSVTRLPLIDRSSLFQELGLKLSSQTIVCTFHPETISEKLTPSFLELLFDMLTKKYSDFQLVLTSSNSDPGGKEINKLLQDISSKFDNIHFYYSLGQKRYFSLLECSDLMLGNTSSGIIEGQSFGIPVLNIGSRQQGRMRNLNTLDSGLEIVDIEEKIKLALSLEFRGKFHGLPNVYGDGEASTKILNFVKEIFTQKNKTEILLKKSVFIS